MTVPRTVRIPEDMYQRIHLRAKLNHRSTNGEIIHMLDTYLSNLEEEEKQLTELLLSGSLGIQSESTEST